MHISRAFHCALVLTVFTRPSVLVAQEDHAHAHEGAALGRVEFPVTCNSEARHRFEHAMGVLHSFWWEEGDNAFNAVLAADPTCAMAYWGLALNAWGNPFAGGPSGQALSGGAAAAAKARAAKAKTPREAGFLAAAVALYRNPETTSNATRLHAYADTMARLYRDLPNDVEVSIYHALALIATAPRTDTTFAQQKKAAAILTPLLARYPNHPGLVHYVIHANDSPQLAAIGLEAARRYAEVAPDSPHAQHMPSHIFVRLGLWEETVQSNIRSYQAGLETAKIEGDTALGYELFHAIDYAVYADLQLGRDSAAGALVELAKGVSLQPSGNPLVDSYNRRAMQARLVLERSDWSGAAAFPAPAANDPLVAAALSRFTRGIGDARSGEADAARAEAAALDSIASALESQPDPYWARVVRIKRDIVDSWSRFASGDTAGGLDLAQAAAEAEENTDKHPITPAELLPARELEADMLLAAGHFGAARTSYEATLKREPGRARSTLGASRASQAGNRGS